MSHTIQHSDGTDHKSYSDSCPKCLCSPVDKQVIQKADFDDTGNWFYPVNFTCLSQKCKHKWTEKFMISQ